MSSLIKINNHMGGFTEIFLRDTSIENIRKQNAKLKALGVIDIHFYSEDDILIEWNAYKNGEGAFPEHSFPRGIKTFEEFKKYWSPEALGVVFCPRTGSLTFDCYFGRTSKRQMNLLRKYLMGYDENLHCNINLIAKVRGSFSTFVERGRFTKLETQILKEQNLL